MSRNEIAHCELEKQTGTYDSLMLLNEEGKIKNKYKENDKEIVNYLRKNALDKNKILEDFCNKK